MRKLLAACAIALFSVHGASAQGLRAAYQDFFTIGVAVNQRNVTDSAQMALIRREFNSITAENDMKPGSVQPVQGRYNWKAADRIADFCRRHGLKLRGHCLVWHNQIGRWMYEDNPSKEVFFERMRKHIHAVVGRYRDVVYCWDVVNEAITDDPHAASPYRQSQLFKIAGEEFIVKAFEYAHEADPTALLFYNDYNECDPVKNRRICEMVSRMKAEGVPVDGIGMQGHYNLLSPSADDIGRAIDNFREVVNLIHVTELDIRVSTDMGGQLRFDRSDKHVTDSIAARHAERYASVFRVLRKNSDIVKSVTFWNLSDRDSWLGAANYALPFDVEYKPKKSYYKIKEVGLE